MIHDLGTKQRIIYESDEPITGVELRVDANITTLFIATTSRILKLAISGKGHGQPPRTVEDQGCGVGCMSVDKETGDIVVGRDDAIYYYTLDGRGPPIAYEAPKKLVSVYQDYIALVSPPTNTGESDTMRRRFWGATADSIFTFTLIHPDLRIIAHSESVLSDVKHIVEIWGDLFTITQEGQVGCSDIPVVVPRLTCSRYSAITRNHCSKDLTCSTNEISIPLPLSWLRNPAWTHISNVSSSENMATTFIKKGTTTRL